jgi:general secretion pathway protein D
VRLDIEQEISQVSNGTSGSPNLTPTISQRKVKSSIGGSPDRPCCWPA